MSCTHLKAKDVSLVGQQLLQKVLLPVLPGKCPLLTAVPMRINLQTAPFCQQMCRTRVHAGLEGPLLVVWSIAQVHASIECAAAAVGSVING